MTSPAGSRYTVRVEAVGSNVKVWRAPAGGGMETLVFDKTTVPTYDGNRLQFGVSPNVVARFDDILLYVDEFGVWRSTTYSYNADNSLASYTDYNGTTSFTYDAWGRPSAQSRTVAGGTQNIEYYYGMDNKLARMDGRDWPDMGVQITEN